VAYEALNLILNMLNAGRRSMLLSLRGFVKSAQTSYAMCSEVINRRGREVGDRDHPHEEDITGEEAKVVRRAGDGQNHHGGEGGG